jgi:hypothetical protein
MKTLTQAIILAFLGLLAFIPATRVAASVDVSVSFHDSLSPYGDWFEHPRFGLVWAPRDVERGWRPYTDGHWEYTDDDWTWVSDSDWGWITCHYGRWFLDPDEGWIWIPGNEWAPAWVIWREGEGYVGWAPMPPDVDAFNIDVDFNLDPFAFAFVEERYLCEPRVYQHFVPVARNDFYLRLTRGATRYTRRDGRIVNRGIDVSEVERVSHRRIPRVALRDAASPREVRGAQANRGWLPVYRPQTIRQPERQAIQAQRNERPEIQRQEIERRQEQARRRFQSDERRERERLRSIQERENAHPERAIQQQELARAAAERRQREDSQARAATERRQQNELQAQAETERRQERLSEARAAGERRQQIERQQTDRAAAREQLRQRHEAERQAQVQHEERERQVFERRQDRERQQTRHGNGQQKQKQDEERHRH